MSALSHSYRPEIDGLRAIAVLSVIFYHAGFSFVSGGFVGVDIFFVISGFLITTIIKNNLDANQFSFADFYERRARRILPALFVVLFISIIFAWLCLIPEEFVLFSRALLAVILFVSNTKLGQENNYFDPINELKPLTHMWSLAVEEQFYILFPVLMIGLWKFQRQRITQIVFIILLLSLLGAEIGSVVKPGENFYFTITRSWELLIGAASAFVIQKVQPNQNLQIIGIIFLAFPLFFLIQKHQHQVFIFFFQHLVPLSSSSTQDQNLFSPVFYPTEYLLFLEKFHIVPICGTIQYFHFIE